MTGIYRITNLVNGKVYIGESSDISSRKQQHKWELDHGVHINQHLQAAWNLYGENNFTFDVVEELPDGCTNSYRVMKEAEWIDKYGGVDSDQNYNLISGRAFGGHSQESRQKISDSLKARYCSAPHPNVGRKMSEDERRKRGEIRRGKKHTEETKLKMSRAQKGHPVSAEQREKLRQARLGKPSFMKGKHFSEEVRQRNREAHIGQVFSDETRKKLSESQRKRIYKPVAQLDLAGNTLAVFRSAGEAARMTNCRYSSIINTCHGRQRTGCGYKWKFISKQDYLVRAHEN